MTEIRPVEVVCAIILRGECFLAALRSQTQSRGGLWEFPGGKRHEHESAAQAIQRECKEELGLGIRILGQLQASFWQYPDISISLLPFVAEIDGSTQPVAHEHEKIRWVSCSEAQKLLWAPADIPVLRSFCQQKATWLPQPTEND